MWVGTGQIKDQMCKSLAKRSKQDHSASSIILSVLKHAFRILQFMTAASDNQLQRQDTVSSHRGFYLRWRRMCFLAAALGCVLYTLLLCQIKETRSKNFSNSPVDLNMNALGHFFFDFLDIITFYQSFKTPRGVFNVYCCSESISTIFKHFSFCCTTK